MTEHYRLAEIGSLVGEPARASILTELMSGRARTAGELAAIARITPQTASEHLAKLLDARLIRIARQGRHRYAAIASPEVAHMLEAMQLVASSGPQAVTRLPRLSETLKRARTCYDHLAGELGVALCDALVLRGHVVCDAQEAQLTAGGQAFAAELGLDLDAPSRSRRPLCRVCLDWSERRPHLAGRFGAALAEHLLEWRWIERAPQGRAVLLTAAGKIQLRRQFGIDLEPGSRRLAAT